MTRGLRPKRMTTGHRLDVHLSPIEKSELELIQKILKENIGVPVSFSGLLRAAVPVYLHHLCSNLADGEWASEYAKLEKKRVININGINPERIPAQA